MRNKTPAVIALFCIFVYVAVVLFAAYRVYMGIDGQRQRAGQELNRLQTMIVESGNEFFSETFREQLRGEIAKCEVLEGIIITGSHGELTFERERGRVIQWAAETPRFIPRFGYASLRARQVDVAGLRNVNIYSVINTINYGYTVEVLKQSLVIILGALILSFLTMIFAAVSKPAEPAKKKKVKPRKPREPHNAAPGIPEAEEQETIPGPEQEGGEDLDDFLSDFDRPGTEDFTLPVEGASPDVSGFGDMAFPEEPVLPAGEQGTEDDFNLDDFLDRDDPPLPGEPPETEVPAEGPDIFGAGEVGPFEGGVNPVDMDGAGPFETEAAKSSPSPAEKAPSPKGLYSPRSNIGWEAYIRDRLDSELHRCAASEQDLSLVLMQCGGQVRLNKTLYRKIADEAVRFFNLRDLSFEYGQRGIAVIIPNGDLNYGISRTEEFHSRILRACGFRSKDDFLAGISSRSGRLIPAERLLAEAGKALEKAGLEKEAPIIAFRSDPEKYREFIRREKTPG
ncbi:MAG: hypothetical protein LBD31_00125 [Treponema sp.]|jgi:hypothetical protein|nr:hypothetical protein [Treponema sp.]